MRHTCVVIILVALLLCPLYLLLYCLFTNCLQYRILSHASVFGQKRDSDSDLAAADVLELTAGAAAGGVFLSSCRLPRLVVYADGSA